jgi:hypothetical protein
MLPLVRLVDQWKTIEQGLPRDWSDVRLKLTVADAADTERAASLLGPLTPGRSGNAFRLFVARRGAAASPAALERALARLDEERIGGALELVGAGEAATVVAAPSHTSLATAWDQALAVLPPDWTDLYCELELTSSDHLEPAALALSPVNPARYGSPLGFRFRVARSFGYGASPEMTRRCLERLDELGIPGALRILHVLSDTKPAQTQGPVWYVGGKAV